MKEQKVAEILARARCSYLALLGGSLLELFWVGWGSNLAQPQIQVFHSGNYGNPDPPVSWHIPSLAPFPKRRTWI